MCVCMCVVVVVAKLGEKLHWSVANDLAQGLLSQEVIWGETWEFRGGEQGACFLLLNPQNLLSFGEFVCR